MQHTVTHYFITTSFCLLLPLVVRCVTVCYSVLQCVTAFDSARGDMVQWLAVTVGLKCFLQSYNKSQSPISISLAQSHWFHFNGTWHRRPRELDLWLRVISHTFSPLVAVCCSVLQCVAVSVLQCVAVCCSVWIKQDMWHADVIMWYAHGMWQSHYCSVLRCIVVYESNKACDTYHRVLQCVAVCCSVLQCDAVCCSVTRIISCLPLSAIISCLPLCLSLLRVCRCVCYVVATISRLLKITGLFCRKYSLS